MNNIRIAKELVLIAKNLIALDDDNIQSKEQQKKLPGQLKDIIQNKQGLSQLKNKRVVDLVEPDVSLKSMKVSDLVNLLDDVANSNQ